MRCKCCNAILDKHECYWIEERQTHEDMCIKCRGKCYENEEEEGVEGLIDMYMGDSYD